MKEILDIIDSAIKRLVSPTAMLVGAALLSRGLDKPESSPPVIVGLMSLLALCALSYLVASAAVAVKEFDDLGMGAWKKGVFSLSFILVYFVLFVSAIYFGVTKIA